RPAARSRCCARSWSCRSSLSLLGLHGRTARLLLGDDSRFVLAGEAAGGGVALPSRRDEASALVAHALLLVRRPCPRRRRRRPRRGDGHPPPQERASRAALVGPV